MPFCISPSASKLENELAEEIIVEYANAGSQGEADIAARARLRRATGGELQFLSAARFKSCDQDS